MKMLFRLVCLFTLTSLSWSALAEFNVGMDTITAAATRKDDLSRQLLIMIFGEVVNNPLMPGSVSFIGQLYGVFNGIIAGMAFFWFVVITLRTTVLSGNRGRVFGDGNTAMAPVSSLIGFMALIPTPSGWSISNLVVLWTASIMGVGSANLLVDKAADAILEGHSLVVQPAAGQTVDAARGIFGMYICQAALNTEQKHVHRHGASSTPRMTTRIAENQYEYVVSNGSATCGSASIPVPAKNDTSWFSFSKKIDTAPIEKAQHAAFIKMNTTLEAAAKNYVAAYSSYRNGEKTKLPDSEQAIYGAAQEYERQITLAAQSINDESNIRKEMNDYLKKNGWIVLGAWYQSFATANNKTNEVAQRSPVVSGMSSVGEVAFKGLYQEVVMNIATQRQNSTYTLPLGSVNQKISDNASDTSSANSAILSIMPFGTEFTAYIISKIMNDSNSHSNSQINPLLKMKAIGDYTLGSAQTLLVGFSALKIAASVASGDNLAAIFLNKVTGSGDIAIGIVDAISPIVYFILFVLLSIGFSLSIFLPFIPFIYWITACASWLVTVLIGTTAGTLWAWTHIGTETDKGGRSSYGYIFLIDAAIRPALMVFGFFFASLVIVAIGTLLNIIFVPAMANVQTDSITGLASFIGILMVYARLCTLLASSAFSLQVYMPDYVLSWLGGKEGIQMMNGAVDSTKNMFASFGSGINLMPSLNKVQRKNNKQSSSGNGMR